MMDFIGDIFFVTVTLFSLIYIYFIISYKYWDRRNFAYLEPKFPLGNSLTFLKFTRNLSLETMHFYDEIKKRSLKFAGVFMVTRPLLVVIDPDYIRDILTKDFNYFVDRGFFYDEKAEPISAHLFALDNIQWRNMRTKLTPTFTSGKMKMMFHSIVEHSKTLVQVCDTFAQTHQDIDIKDILANYTTDVIGSCAFGLEMKSFDSKEAEFRKFGRLLFQPEGVLQTLKMSITTIMPDLAKTLGIVGIRKDIVHFFTNLVNSTVKYREENKIYRPDFLQLLIDIKNNEKCLTMDQILAQVFLFFIAGFETSSSAMNFALYELSQQPELQEKLRTEIKDVLQESNGEITYDNIKQMTYLEQVLDETLRLYPPVPNLQRVCIADYKMRNTDLIIEKGTPVVIPIISLHRDEEHYPNAAKFDPEGFSKENKSERHHYLHLPFGEGPRNCIGLRFGVMQTKIGLIQILKHFKVTLSPSTKMPLTFNKEVFLLATNETLYLKAERL